MCVSGVRGWCVSGVLVVYDLWVSEVLVEIQTEY